MDFEKEVNRLAATFDIAAGKLSRLILALDPATFSERETSALRAKVQEISIGLVAQAFVWARRTAGQAYRESRTMNVSRLRLMGKKPQPKTGEKKHEQTMKHLAETVRDDFAKAALSISQMVDRYVGAIRHVSGAAKELQAFSIADYPYIGKLVDKAVAQGLSRYDFKKKLMAYLKRQIGAWEFLTIKGRNYNLKSYAELVARTRLREAQTEATKNVADEYDNDLVEIPFKENSCDICQKIQGRVYSLNGATPGYEVLSDDAKPPIHPNCEHYIRATSVEALAYRFKGRT